MTDRAPRAAVCRAHINGRPYLTSPACCLRRGDQRPAVNRSGGPRRLDKTVARIAAHAVALVVGRRVSEGETAKQLALRQSLRSEPMGPIAVIARLYLRCPRRAQRL